MEFPGKVVLDEKKNNRKTNTVAKKTGTKETSSLAVVRNCSQRRRFSCEKII